MSAAIWDLLKIILPAGLVLYAMFLMVKSFLDKSSRDKALNIRTKNVEVIMPIRLQAYERMALFLERIYPDNLIARVNDASYSAQQLQQLLLMEIRQEFNHNLSQQVYMSNEVWQMIRNAKEELILSINQAAKEVAPDEKGIALAKKIIEQTMNHNVDSISYALTRLKEEIQLYF